MGKRDTGRPATAGRRTGAVGTWTETTWAETGTSWAGFARATRRPSGSPGSPPARPGGSHSPTPATRSGSEGRRLGRPPGVARRGLRAPRRTSRTAGASRLPELAPRHRGEQGPATAVRAARAGRQAVGAAGGDRAEADAETDAVPGRRPSAEPGGDGRGAPGWPCEGPATLPADYREVLRLAREEGLPLARSPSGWAAPRGGRGSSRAGAGSLSRGARAMLRRALDAMPDDGSPARSWARSTSAWPAGRTVDVEAALREHPELAEGSVRAPSRPWSWRISWTAP